MNPMQTRELARLGEQITVLEQRNAELVRALEWYANTDNFCHDLEGNNLATAWRDGGITKKAKAALNPSQVQS